MPFKVETSSFQKKKKKKIVKSQKTRREEEPANKFKLFNFITVLVYSSLDDSTSLFGHCRERSNNLTTLPASGSGNIA